VWTNKFDDLDSAQLWGVQVDDEEEDEDIEDQCSQGWLIG
jgi:hypothetical protein